MKNLQFFKNPLLLATLLLSAFVLFFNISKGSFVNSDELLYIRMAQEMSDTGNVFDISYHGGYDNLKPPLAIWIYSLTGSIAGFSEGSMRFPSVLSAIITLFMLAQIATALFKDTRTASFSTIILICSAIFYFNARRPMMDMFFIMGMLVFIWSYLKGLEKSGYFIISGISFAWMFMDKGAVVFLPLVPVLTDLLLRRRFDLFRNKSAITGIILALILILPWHIIQAVRYGSDFFSDYIELNLVQRTSSPLYAAADASFYIERFIEDEGMLSLFFLFGIIFTTWRFISLKLPEDRFLLLWMIFLFVPFEIAETKIPHYMLPLYPALAVMAAGSIAAFTRKTYFSIFFIAAMSGIFFVHNFEDMTNPDYTPDQKKFAEIIMKNQKNDTIAAFNHYDLAIFHYSDTKVRLVTDSREMYSILMRAPQIARADAVELLSLQEFINNIPPEKNLFLLTLKTLSDSVLSEVKNSGKFASVQKFDGRALTLISGLHKP